MPFSDTVFQPSLSVPQRRPIPPQLAESRRRLQQAQEGEATDAAALASDRTLLAEAHQALSADTLVLQQASTELAAELVLLRKLPSKQRPAGRGGKAAAALHGACRGDSEQPPSTVSLGGSEDGSPRSAPSSGGASPSSPLSPRIAAGPPSWQAEQPCGCS